MDDFIIKNNERGQVLLMVLLSVAVVVTVSLSVVSRSISDVTITSQEEESLRAFNAAESGIEEVLVQNLLPGESLESQIVSDADTPLEAKFDAAVSSFPDATQSFSYPVRLANGEIATVWLIGHSGDSLTCVGETCYTADTLELCFGDYSLNPLDSAAPAIEVSLLYENSSGALRMANGAFDPNSSRRASNSFSDVTSLGTCSITQGTTTTNYLASVDINFNSFLNETSGTHSTPGRLKALLVRFLYNTSSQPFGVVGIANLPTQGKLVSSLGTSGEASRKVQVYQLFPTPPEIFNSALFSNSSITK